ncbi:extracellular metalloprotease [Klebsiella michiganensis]|nr:extracellular metalloprotease [Klebsiella michiganensis]
MPDAYPRYVIPPYILRRIVDRGSLQQQRCAQNTLSHVQTLMAHVPGRPAAPHVTTPGLLERDIYDAGQTQDLPGTQVRFEGQPSNGDVAVDEAYDYLGITHDFFWKSYQRDSLDNRGLKLTGSVHYGHEYQNAFWNGQQMVFGDGDGEIFNRFTIAIDVVAHELSHGVTESEAGLIYFEQSGALNESLSDVFGSLVKQYQRQQTADKADWIIGEGLLAKGIHGKGLRSMSQPGTAYDDPILGKDPQPAHMKDFVHTQQDNGGVHINSGIPNHAFYLAASALGGFAWEKAGYAWYDAVCDQSLAKDADFLAFARLTIRHGEKTLWQRDRRGDYSGLGAGRSGAMNLADLSDDAVIELAREGGVAWIPALSGMRKIVVAKLNEQQKQRIATILQQSLPLGKPPGQPDSPGRGDQRFFSHSDRQRTALPQPDYSHPGGSCARFTG